MGMNQQSDKNEGFKVSGRQVGADAPPFVVAEISGNHGGELAKALELIEAAAEAGADAVKFQTYEAHTITIDSKDPAFIVDTPLWQGRHLFDLYQQAQTPFSWHADLFAKAAECGLLAFSAPFDLTAVELLEELDCPLYKIASCELVDIGLIEAVAKTGKPMIMSTGMASFAEIEEALLAARSAGARDIALLHCISGYPSEASDANLASLAALSERFEVAVGLSDHSAGVTLPVAAIALGACIVEKHLCLKRGDGAVDSDFSLVPSEFKLLVQACKDAQRSVGTAVDGAVAAEADSLRFRRSLYIVEDVVAGEMLTSQNVRSIRPAGGMHTRHLRKVVGKAAKQDIKAGTPLAWEMIEGQGCEP